MKHLISQTRKLFDSTNEFKLEKVCLYISHRKACTNHELIDTHRIMPCGFY